MILSIHILRVCKPCKINEVITSGEMVSIIHETSLLCLESEQWNLTGPGKSDLRLCYRGLMSYYLHCDMNYNSGLSNVDRNGEVTLLVR